MDVSNSTGQDTQYRVATGGTKLVAASWQPLAKQSTCICCADLKAPWTIDFQLPDGTVVSATFDHPMANVVLEKRGNHYKIKAHRAAA